MMPKCFAYLFTFIFVFTCSGSNNKTEVILTANEIINLSNSYSYTPPMSTSKDNCVSRSNESYGSWHENFDSTLDIAKKVTEEAGETSISAVSNDGRVIDESADLVFHLLVLLNASGFKMRDVMNELIKRSSN